METNIKQLRERYPAIVAWGRMMGSMDYYIDSQVLLAAKENAPENATFKGDGEWRTVNTIASPETKLMIENYLKKQ